MYNRHHESPLPLWNIFVYHLELPRAPGQLQLTVQNRMAELQWMDDEVDPLLEYRVQLTRFCTGWTWTTQLKRSEVSSLYRISNRSPPSRCRSCYQLGRNRPAFCSAGDPNARRRYDSCSYYIINLPSQDIYFLNLQLQPGQLGTSRRNRKLDIWLPWKTSFFG